MYRPYTKNVDQETMEKRKKTLIWSKISQKRLFTFIVFRSFFKNYPTPLDNIWKNDKRK